MARHGGAAGWSAADLAAGRAVFLLGMVLVALALVASRPPLMPAAAAAAIGYGLFLLHRAGRSP